MAYYSITLIEISTMVLINLATIDDLDQIILCENTKHNKRFICPNSEEEHKSNFANEDIDYLVIRAQNDKRFIGYIILAGKNNSSNKIELRRIALLERGKGYGRKAIQWVKDYVFKDLGKNRLELDVFDFNEIGRKLYLSEGFIEEGIIRQVFLTEKGYQNLVIMSILKKDYHS
ncbi:MAG: GNAT family N-acetyltransferase [Saprospiraceae bacterium]